MAYKKDPNISRPNGVLILFTRENAFDLQPKKYNSMYVVQ